jgi:FkbM family methyltransferase
MTLFRKFHQALTWFVQSIVFSSRIAGDMRTFFELIFIMSLAYTDRKKTALRRRLCALAGYFLQSPKEKEVYLLLRINKRKYRFVFPNHTSGEFWTIRSILIEILIKKTYHPASLLSSPQWIVDAGANLGLATLYFSSLYPSAQFICYEPSSDTFRYLLKNLEANAIPHKAFQKAVADYEGFSSFLTSRSSMERQLDSAFSAETAEADESEMVEVVTLHSELNKLGIRRVDLVKFDVEGAETALLRGLGDALARVRAFAGEVHGPELAAETSRILRINNFNVTLCEDHLHATNNSTSERQG